MTLLGTYKLTANTQQFAEDRHMHESFLQEGVVGAGDYKVTPGGASLQWSVAAGVAWVQGDTAARQGIYPQVNDAAVTGTVAPGHATLPRLDQVILQIADSSVTGASNTPTLSTLAGTATSGATLDNRTGAASLPATALLLADVLVPAAQSGVLTTAMIRDRRKWARGAYKRIVRNANAAAGNDYTVTGTTPAAIDATNLTTRIEASGLPLRLRLTGIFTHTIVGSVIILSIQQDGSVVDGQTQVASLTVAAASQQMPVTLVYDFVPTAGSHVYVPFWTGGASGTATLFARSGIPVGFSVEELFRQNADNT